MSPSPNACWTAPSRKWPRDILDRPSIWPARPDGRPGSSGGKRGWRTPSPERTRSSRRRRPPASTPRRSCGTSNRPGPLHLAGTLRSRTVRRGVFGDIPLLAQRARNSLREGRVVAAAEAALREVRREASREKRKGADVTRAEVLLDQAEVAMATKDFGKVKGLATDAHDAVREATLIKTVRDAFASLQMDRDDLKNLGADIAGYEQTLVRLGAALGGQA